MVRDAPLRPATILAGFALVILALAGCTAAGHDWPRWRGPNGDGISRETGWNPKALEGGPRVLWTVPVGIGYSNVAIARGRLYTMGMKGGNTAVQCLEADTGKEIWHYDLPGYNDPQSTPAVSGTSVYALSFKGVLLCIDAGNGKLRWKKDLVAEYGAVQPYYGFSGSPLVASGLLILNVNTSGMALNQNTGQLVWGSEKPLDKVERLNSYYSTGTDYSTPVLYSHRGKRYALFSSLKGILSVAVETGEPLWLHPWGWYSGGVGGDLLVLGNKILITYDKKDWRAPAESVLLDTEEEKPRVVWKSQDLWSEFATPVILNGYIYGCLGGPNSRPTFLRCISLESGRMVWEKGFGKSYHQDGISLMAADGKLIILTDQGMLSIAEAGLSGYQEISSCDVFGDEKKIRRFWTPPVLCNGRIYCRNYSGELLCIDVSK